MVGPRAPKVGRRLCDWIYITVIKSVNGLASLQLNSRTRRWIFQGALALPRRGRFAHSEGGSEPHKGLINGVCGS